MDGLSNAAGVAGILSLGIQVTQNLVNFYSACKSQKVDISHTLKRLKHLSSILETLREQLASRKFPVDEQKLAQNIENEIQFCEECVLDLQCEAEKFNSKPLNSVQAITRTAAYRIAYPFRQSTLQKLEEIIGEIVSHLSLALKALELKYISNVQDDVKDVAALLNLVRAEQVSSSIRSWLNAPDTSSDYNMVSDKRYGDTGLWLAKSSAFLMWLGKPNSLLWLYGFAGCGKSVLCSTAINNAFQHRRSSPRVGIAFFFFSFSDKTKQDASSMLRALVLQLSGQLGSNHEVLNQLHQRYINSAPPRQALLECLRQLVRSFNDTYLILDALDESPRGDHRRDMLKALADMRKWSELGLHLLVTSRDEPDIRDGLNALSDESISLKNDHVNSDIASFISGSLKTDYRLQKWAKYHEQIETALTKRSKGVFRWVECQFIALESCAISKRRLDVLLNSLPRSLDETYERMLLNIPEGFAADAKRILTMLCCTENPVSVTEVIESMTVELGDNPHVDVDARLEDEDDIYRMCPGLIEFDLDRWEEERTVRIAHFSVQEYLMSERIYQHAAASFGVKAGKAHAEMACIYLTYLLESVPQSTLSSFSLMKPRHSFLHYAANRWHSHYRDGDQSFHPVKRQISRLFRYGESGWQDYMISSTEISFQSRSDDDWSTRLYHASYIGLDWLLPELFRDMSSTNSSSRRISDIINATGGILGNCLHAASAKGHENVVKLLLDEGADVNAKGSDTKNVALYLAVKKDHENIVRLLLENGADINAQGGFYRHTSLHAAVERGNEKIVRLLIENGAEVNNQDNLDREAPLCLAARQGHENIVRLLLEKGAEVNIQGGYPCEAPLHFAAKRGHENIVRLLLEKRAEVNIRSESCHETPLHLAARGGHENTVRLLIEKGAGFNTQGYIFVDDPLCLAAKQGHENTCRVLLEKGAEVDSQCGKRGETPLQEVSARGFKNTVRLSLDKGADVNMQGGGIFSNALWAALENGHENIVRLLLAKGANMNLKDSKGCTMLSHAAARGNETLVKLLLASNDIQQDLRDNLNRSPAFYALRKGQHQILRLLLLGSQIDLNFRDHYGATLLSAATRNGNMDMVKFLLSFHGIDINIQDKFGRTPLRWARRMERGDLVKLLIDNGATEGILDEKNDPTLDDKLETSDCVAGLNHTHSCDVCTGNIGELSRYHCGICNGGDFDICSDCYDAGARCPDADHSSLEKIH